MGWLERGLLLLMEGCCSLYRLTHNALHDGNCDVPVEVLVQQWLCVQLSRDRSFQELQSLHSIGWV